ncbi:MAG: ABC transporter permease [bacterium]|nr:ABC transporter permease [bacterium]MCY4258124.1 ABC transporter permease [bacterium]
MNQHDPTATTSDTPDQKPATTPQKWAVWSAQPTSPAATETTNQTTAHYAGSAVRQTLRRFMRMRASVVCCVLLLLLTTVSVAAPLLATHDPDATDLSSSLVSPSGDHWLGTDQIGRDTYSRLIYAGRVSLLAAVEALVVSVGIGLPLGLVAGFARGKTDAIISAVTDAVMAMPGLLLAIAIIGAIGPGLTNAMIAVGVLLSPRFVRLVRASVISVRENAYIEAAITSGTSPVRIMGRHVIPNILPPLLVQAAFTTGFAMLAEASLSFLGLGVQPPQASWGSMLNSAYQTINQSSFQPIPPGIAIAVAVLAFNVIGDGLRASIGREEYRS